MKIIKQYEEIYSGERKFSKSTDNQTIAEAYSDYRYEVKPRIDFDGVIWIGDVVQIWKALKESDITEFTISSHQSNILEILDAFSDFDITISGLTSIRDKYSDTGFSPAFLMKLETINP